jgi:uncharacterized membrane protein (DUF485 family)
VSTSDPDVPSELAAHERATDRRNARYGLVLFAVYLALYGGFMAWNVVDPLGLARPALFGVNVAIVYGFALIGFALVLALVYMTLCRRPVRGVDKDPS